MFCSKNCIKDLRLEIFNYLGIKPNMSVGKYLGFPIFMKAPSINNFQFIIDNLQKKMLAGWKTSF